MLKRIALIRVFCFVLLVLCEGLSQSEHPSVDLSQRDGLKLSRSAPRDAHVEIAT
jgi:hypothetical protein